MIASTEFILNPRPIRKKMNRHKTSRYIYRQSKPVSVTCRALTLGVAILAAVTIAIVAASCSGGA